MNLINLDDFQKIKGVQFTHFDRIRQSLSAPVNINTDSRTIKKGEIFWALRGDNFDGQLFVKDVASKGALFAVVQLDFIDGEVPAQFPLLRVPDTLSALQELAALHRRRFTIPLIGVTGSNGKTTLKEMIAHTLAQRFKVHKTEGNYNNHIGCPLTLLKLNQQHEVAVVEMGTNHPGEINMLTRIGAPTQAIITNIGGAHLENFITVAAIAKEKLTLFDAIPEDGVIYKNLDDPYIAAYQREQVFSIGYSLEKEAQVKGRIVSFDEQGCGRFALNNSTEIQLKTGGLHNIKNALAAAAVGGHFGLDDREIREALESYLPFSKRMQTMFWHGVTFINDAYNANPDSMKAAFQTLQSMRISGRLFLVLGDMFELGPAGVEMHRDVLQEALHLNPQRIMVMGQLMAAARSQVNSVSIGKIQYYDDYALLAKDLQSCLKSGDCVLIKGSRGMTMEKVFDYFNDLMSQPKADGAAHVS